MAIDRAKVWDIVSYVWAQQPMPGVPETARAAVRAAANAKGVTFCNEVVHQPRETGTATGAGLVAKTPGQEHGIGADGNLYAVDAIWVDVPEAASADIIVGAGGPTPTAFPRKRRSCFGEKAAPENRCLPGPFTAGAHGLPNP